MADVTTNRTGQRRPKAPDDDVTASEVAAYAYCAKAWHLERVLGVRSSRAAAKLRSAGVARHATHGARVVALRSAGRALALGAAALLALAALLAVAALLLGR